MLERLPEEEFLLVAVFLPREDCQPSEKDDKMNYILRLSPNISREWLWHSDWAIRIPQDPANDSVTSIAGR